MTDNEIAAFLASAGGPFRLVNLLVLRDIAAYEDGRPSVSGKDAYQRYLDVAKRHIAALGGELLTDNDCSPFGGEACSPEWHRLIIVHYPSAQALAMMLAEPTYQSALVHRTAAIAHNLTICVPDHTGS